MNNFPKTLPDAVAAGLHALTDDAREELARVGFVDPHTEYRIDFEKIVWDALGLDDGLNPELLTHVAINHANELNFADTDGHTVDPRVVLRIVLARMVKATSGSGLRS